LALAYVVALLEPELVDVEVERLFLVQDVDRGDVQPGDHVVRSPVCMSMRMTLTLRFRTLRPLLQNCSLGPTLRPQRVGASPPAGRSGARRWGRYPSDSPMAFHRRSW